MAHATRLNLDSPPALAGTANLAPPGDEARLHNVLKRCAPSTLEAALQFRKTARPGDLRTLVHGVVERYVEPELRHRIRDPQGDLRLVEDLGLDSLTLMQIVFRLEEVLQISVRDEDLRQFRTLGEVCQFIEHTATDAGATASPPSNPPYSHPQSGSI